MNRLDPRLPLVFDIKDLGRRPGAMVKRTLTVEAPEDLGTDVIAIPAGQPLELDLGWSPCVEGILVTGSVSGTANGACVRCLDPVTAPVTRTSRTCSSTPIARSTPTRWAPTTTRTRCARSWA